MISDSPYIQTDSVSVWAVPRRFTTGNATCIESWIVLAPRMHADFMIKFAVLVHLRPPTKLDIKHPGSTHEFVSGSVDPRYYPITSLDPHNFNWIKPVDISVQFKADNDADALGRVTDGLFRMSEDLLSLEPMSLPIWAQILRSTEDAERHHYHH